MKIHCKFKKKSLVINASRDLLGKGGQGSIFKVSPFPDLVAKIYHEPDEKQDKIEAMYENPPKDDATPGHVSLAWPVDLVFDADSGGDFKGFLMKRIDDTQELHQIANPSSRRKTYPFFNHKYLHIAAANIASAFAAAHEKGYVVGDVKDQNVLINERALITLVDTDSFQVPNKITGGVFPCTVGTPEFTPPELQGLNLSTIDRTTAHDLFGLGVLIFQLLMGGFHPFSGVPDKSAEDWTPGERISRGNFAFGRKQKPLKISPLAPSLSILHPKLQKLFTRCFEDGARKSVLRPGAMEWRRAIRLAADELVTCSEDGDHLFGNHLKSCPWCERDQKISSLAKKRKKSRSLPTSLSPPRQQPAPSPPVRYAPPPPPPPPPEIVPGRWKIIPDLRNMGEMGVYAGMMGVSSDMTLDLDSNGSMAGSSVTKMVGMTIPIGLNGSWSYDVNGKVLTLNALADLKPMTGEFGMFLPPMPSQPINLGLRITSGSSGNYQAFDTVEGKPWIINSI